MALCAVLLLYGTVADASAATGKTGATASAGLTAASTPASASTGRGGGGGGGGKARQDPRAVPPLDPTRTVSEQDCTKPVDLSQGNLKCK